MELQKPTQEDLKTNLTKIQRQLPRLVVRQRRLRKTQLKSPLKIQAPSKLADQSRAVCLDKMGREQLLKLQSVSR